MFEAYWHYISAFDWIILSVGTVLMLFQLVAIILRCISSKVFFIQQLGRIQSACLQWTELLPVLGLIGTVLAMLNTFSAFDVTQEGGVNVVEIIKRFAPAMTTTLSGLFMVVVNLPLNQLLYLLIPRDINRKSE